MHESSMNRMKEFVADYLDPNKPLTILDVGSFDVNGSYRHLFNNPNWKYFGLDIEAGNNVDIVAKGLYNWDTGRQFDVIISGQCLEHVKDVKEWILQINENLKSGGIVCIVAPWTWEEHRYPVDCWRILPDGMRFLLGNVCNFEIMKIFKQETDCIGIAIKRKEDGGISPKISSLRYQQGIINLDDQNSSHALTVNMVGKNKRVLEVGPSTGYITKVLKNRGNKVTCIELDKESAEIAKKFCDRMVIGDIESVELDSYLEPGQFDVILLGDVLEHLKWPANVLKKIRKYLKPEGYIVASIPNIGHGDVILNLMNQKFSYTSKGLLDLTHLRFFTLPSVNNLFDESGYTISELKTIQLDLGGTELGDTIPDVPQAIINFVKKIPHSTTYQFVIKAYPKENQKVTGVQVPMIDISSIRILETDEICSPKELDLAKKENAWLTAEINSIKSSITWRFVMRLDSVIGKIAPLGTGRRKFYDMSLARLKNLP